MLLLCEFNIVKIPECLPFPHTFQLLPSAREAKLSKGNERGNAEGKFCVKTSNSLAPTMERRRSLGLIFLLSSDALLANAIWHWEMRKVHPFNASLSLRRTKNRFSFLRAFKSAHSYFANYSHPTTIDPCWDVNCTFTAPAHRELYAFMANSLGRSKVITVFSLTADTLTHHHKFIYVLWSKINDSCGKAGDDNREQCSQALFIYHYRAKNNS